MKVTIIVVTIVIMEQPAAGAEKRLCKSSKPASHGPMCPRARSYGFGGWSPTRASMLRSHKPTSSKLRIGGLKSHPSNHARKQQARELRARGPMGPRATMQTTY